MDKQTIVEFWNKDTINNDRYFRDKYTISSKDFTIRDYPDNWDPYWNIYN